MSSFNNNIENRKVYLLQFPDAEEATVNRMFPIINNAATIPQSNTIILIEKQRQIKIKALEAAYLTQYPNNDLECHTLFKDKFKYEIIMECLNMIKQHKDLNILVEMFNYYPWLLNSNPTIEDSPSKRTVLHWACEYDRFDVVDVLLNRSYRISLTSTEENGFIPLHLAVKNGCMKSLMLVLSKSSSLIDFRDNAQRTPLMLAAFFGQYEIANKLLELGCNFDAKNINNLTAYDIAKQQRNNQICKLIKQFQSQLVIKIAQTAALNRWLENPFHKRAYKAWTTNDRDNLRILLIDEIKQDSRSNLLNIELVRTNR